MNVFVDRGPALRGKGPVLVVDGEEIEGIPEGVIEKVCAKIKSQQAEIDRLNGERDAVEEELEEEKGRCQEQFERCERLEDGIKALKERAKSAGVDLDKKG